MPAQVGKRYVTPAGAEVIVTKGGPGELSDGEVGLRLKEEADGDFRDASGRTEPVVQLGAIRCECRYGDAQAYKTNDKRPNND